MVLEIVSLIIFGHPGNLSIVEIEHNFSIQDWIRTVHHYIGSNYLSIQTLCDYAVSTPNFSNAN